MVDEALITVVAGDGGDGAVAFFPFKAGPCGGDGGKGADVYAVASANVTHLRKYVERTKFKADDGEKGAANRQIGAGGKDLILEMPIGTTIIDTTTRQQVELNKNNPRVRLATGGAGGKGNDSFKSPTNRTPRQFTNGAPGEEHQYKLLMKLIADFGFIGLPNAGKSSLLNELTAAHAKTADYPFTTLEPNLGVLNRKIIADIPGLIEGASVGKGLGVKFLKHVEKVQLLIHCVSVENEDVKAIYQTVRKELETYNPQLLKKQEIVLLTKVDLVDKKEMEKKLKILQKLNPNASPISVHDWDALEKLKKMLQ